MKAALIGFGRFGKLFYKFFKNDFDFQIYDKYEYSFNRIKLKSLNEFDNDVSIIFFAIPISSFLEISKTLRKKLDQAL